MGLLVTGKRNLLKLVQVNLLRDAVLKIQINFLKSKYHQASEEMVWESETQATLHFFGALW